MKKKKTANIIMVAVIAVIVVGGVLVAGHIKGWFDRSPDVAVLTNYKGIITLEREGIAFNVQEDTALRKGDKISCSPAATVKIDAGDGSIVLGESAQVVVEDPSKDSLSISVLSGEVFADAKNRDMSISFGGGKTVSLVKSVASLSIRAGAQSMSVYYGEADGVSTGNVKEWIGTDEFVHELDINSLNDFNISQIRAAGNDSGLCFSKADVDELEARRKAEIEEARRKAEEKKAAEEAAKKAEEERKAAEAAKKAEEEAAKKAEEEAARIAREQAEREAAEEAAKKAEAEKKAAEEAAAKAEAEKKAAEEAAAKAEEDRKAAEEAAAKSRSEAEKKAAEEAAAKAEEDRKAAEAAAAKAEADRKAAEEAAAKAQSEAEKKAAQEAAAKAEADKKAAQEAAAKAEADKKAAEEAAAKAEAERKAAEEAAAKAREEAAKKAAEEAAAREEAERKAAEEAAAREAAEEAARIAAEEEAARKAAEEEAARKAEEEAARIAAEEAARKAAEEEAARIAEEEAKKKHCFITIRCETILNNWDDLDPAKAPYVPDSGYILGQTEVSFEEGETVFDVLKRVCDTYGIQIEYSWTPMYNSYYIEGINNLYEFDCGNQSGWMYKVNGWFPNYGCSSYYLQDGDDIIWCYTCKGLGTDVGAPPMT